MSFRPETCVVFVYIVPHRHGSCGPAEAGPYRISLPDHTRIRIAVAGKIVVDQDLVDRVTDNYAGWKEDPRYHEWMTNPQMRIVIGEREQDEYKIRQRP